MYYLDFFALHKMTNKSDRIALRKTLDRDSAMERRLKVQHNQCFYCAAPITMADHLDHILPIYYGGQNNKANLVAACRDCNLTKSTGQIEITNQYTIQDYLKLIEAKRKWREKLRVKPWLRRHPPKRVQLYGVYHAKLFRHL